MKNSELYGRSSHLIPSGGNALLNEQFDRILFVVNLAQPNTTLCQTGAELNTRFAMQRSAATALMPPREGMSGL